MLIVALADPALHPLTCPVLAAAVLADALHHQELAAVSQRVALAI